jgi:hypothetical protein
MASRRFKGKPHVQRQELAIRVMGEMHPRFTGVYFHLWQTEDGPPNELNCDSLKGALQARETIRLRDLNALEDQYWGPLGGTPCDPGSR